MFYAMAENKIDLRGYRFDHRLADIQTLNERARRGELHISAISIHAYPYVAKNYALLPCGASMGDGYGPIIVRKHPTRLRKATARQAPNSGSFARAARFGVRRLDAAFDRPTPNEDVDARESLRKLCDRCAGQDDERISCASTFCRRVRLRRRSVR
jgi:hypothetical protein